MFECSVVILCDSYDRPGNFQTEWTMSHYSGLGQYLTAIAFSSSGSELPHAGLEFQKPDFRFCIITPAADSSVLRLTETTNRLWRWPDFKRIFNYSPHSRTEREDRVKDILVCLLFTYLGCFWLRAWRLCPVITHWQRGKEVTTPGQLDRDSGQPANCCLSWHPKGEAGVWFSFLE